MRNKIHGILVCALMLLGIFGHAYAGLPGPPIKIALYFGPYQDTIKDMVSHNLSRGEFNSYSVGKIETPDESPALGNNVDIYHGMVKANGNIISWVPPTNPGNPSSDRADIVSGLAPLDANKKLDGFMYTGHKDNSYLYMEYKFMPEDVPGLYIFFILVVDAGKNPADPGNWITSKTRIVSVKP